MGEHNCYRTDETECIKEKAYELWEKGGRKQGRDLNYWLDAEKNVKTNTNNDSPKGKNINQRGRK